MGIGNKVSVAWPAALKDEAVANNAEGIAEVAHTLAGRARMLYEHATGGPSSADDPISIPKNPQGLFGHDHSGPPYGSCFMHTLFAWAGIAGGGSDWTRYESFSLSLSRPTLQFRFRAWVRPFPSHVIDSPYSRLYLDLRAKTGSSYDVGVRMKSNNGPEQFDAAAIPITAGEANYSFSDFFLTPKPGWNDFFLELSNDAGASIEFISIALSQIVKRSH